MTRTHRLRRSLLFVPGSEPRRLERARSSGADTVLFDLEDGVAPNAKHDARSLVAAALRAGGFGDSEAAVRVNGVGSPHCGADLETVVAAGATAIMLPKCERGEQLRQIGDLLSRCERAAGRADGAVRILALIETAAGVVNAAALAAASPRLDALCFGHADLARDLGLDDADASHGTLCHARSSVVLAARAHGLPPIDSVCLTVRDDDAIHADVALGLRLGFDGKLCIHPRQVEIANALYTPSPERIAAAQRIIEAARAAERDGHGVITLDGRMVDAPIVAAEERILARARRAGALAG
ncbi:MAG: CoA ester lyase [Deltaproteobacteria bacterium]|nr:CoA ester lyase [Deltaproteobacteria bacterium]